jgi:hypothetical protein
MQGQQPEVVFINHTINKIDKRRTIVKRRARPRPGSLCDMSGAPLA